MASVAKHQKANKVPVTNNRTTESLQLSTLSCQQVSKGPFGEQLSLGGKRR